MIAAMRSNQTAVRWGNALLAGCALLAGAGCGPASPKGPEPAPGAVTFKPQELADALHAVIAADREAYARQVVQPLAEARAAGAPEAWPAHGSPPGPERMLRLASEAVQQKGAEFHYVLRSLWPIDPKDAPQTPTEKAGLEYLPDHPESNYYAEESLGGRRYFTAVYPDRAIVPACVQCHNRRPDSPKRDFKPGDVMGGIVVRVPLEF